MKYSGRSKTSLEPRRAITARLRGGCEGASGGYNNSAPRGRRVNHSYSHIASCHPPLSHYFYSPSPRTMANWHISFVGSSPGANGKQLWKHVKQLLLVLRHEKHDSISCESIRFYVIVDQINNYICWPLQKCWHYIFVTIRKKSTCLYLLW